MLVLGLGLETSGFLFARLNKFSPNTTPAGATANPTTSCNSAALPQPPPAKKSAVCLHTTKRRLLLHLMLLSRQLVQNNLRII
jgi:hypothetical protein